MKRVELILIMLLCMLIQYVPANAMTLEYDGGIHEYDGSIFTLIVNDSVLNPPLSPIIFNDHALVPVREIFEELGAEVDYENETRKVDVIKDEYTVSLAINDNVAYINGEKTVIPDGVAPKLISEYGGETKTMVPVRFISESIGLDVDFDEEHGAILVESSNYDFGKPEKTEPPAPKKASITDIECWAEDNTEYRIAVSADRALKGFDSFTMKNPDRLVIDMYGATYNNAFSDKTVNKIGIDKVRFGENDERARIVVDSSRIEDYYIEKKSDREIEVVITTSEEREVKTPAPVSTKKPIRTMTPIVTPNTKPTSAPSVIATPTPTPQPKKVVGYKNLDNSEKLIVLDAGHGGTDSGAVGYLNGNQVLEKNLTLEITKKVKERLEERGYKVSMTRTGDTLPSLVERPTQANAEDAAVFVSIHINSVANAPEANGTEVYYAESNNGNDYKVNSKTLAQNILTRMMKYMKNTNRGVKTAEHAVTKRCNMPASLVEVGFITNPTEVYNMTTEEYQYKAAQGITEGIIITLENIDVPIYER